MNKNRPLEKTIDISNSKNEIDLIKSIIQQLDFPNLYCFDWKGLGESFFYDPMIKMPKKLTIKGLELLKKKMPNSFKKLKKCLDDYKENNKEFELSIE